MATSIFTPGTPVDAVRVVIRMKPWGASELVSEVHVEIPDTGETIEDSLRFAYEHVVTVATASYPWGYDSADYVVIPVYEGTAGARVRVV